jgi:copper binding plastocyanin/azurin family protein
MESRVNTSRSPFFFLSSLLIFSMLIIGLLLLSRPVHAEDVIFIVPGSADPASVLRFDPPVQIIGKGQSIVFVNPDGLDHHLVVKSADGSEEFDTGVLSMNNYVSHTFLENGEYTFECKIYPHMKGEIRVTDDIATFTRTIDNQNLDVQLTQSPANPGVNEEVFYKLTFVDKETGRNHPHIDFILTFNDSSGTYVDGIGGHTVDGQDFAVFKFDKEDAFTPAVTVSGVEFIPISPETVRFDTVVTPEFPLIGVGAVLASALGAIALYMRK